MKKRILLSIVFLGLLLAMPAAAQIPDDTDGRLYRLCKTWGYFKYYSQHKCELKWDTLLCATIEEVLAVGTNEEFNQALMDMFNKVGNNFLYSNPGPEPDTNLNFDISWIDDPVFSQPVRDFLDTFSLHIYPDTSTCLVHINDFTGSYYGYIDFSDDPLSMFLNYTNEADRLTAMIYYWNVISYFFPYRGIMDQPWDSTLLQFIPQIRQAVTVPEFHKAFLRMVTMINDSHGFTSSPALGTYFWGGAYVPKIYFTRVGAQCVVAKVDGIAGVTPGDVLISLKGIPMDEIEDSLRNYIPASTPAALYRNMYLDMLRGNLNSTLSMTFLDSLDNPFTINVQRTMDLGNWYAWSGDPGLTSSYFVTDCDYGYVNMGLLLPEEVPEMYEALKDAPAIIFDLRNYPNGTLWDLGPMFFQAPITSALYHEPALFYYGRYYYPGWYYIEDDHYNLGNWNNPNAYNGDLLILVNQETQSQSEYTVQYFWHHPNAKVIGTQTAGADGNVSYFTLPGSISTYFTSLGWYYDDGYQQQRNGVIIDSVVTPTREGFRHGKDEILLAALDCLTGVSKLENTKTDILVYPNPVNDQVLHISIELDAKADITMSLFSMTGDVISERTFQGVTGKNQFTQDLPDVARGLYLLRVQYGDKLNSIKIILN